jgi:hypothetical protein
MPLRKFQFRDALARSATLRHIRRVSTIAEIQDAIEKLPPQDKQALSTWLASQEEMEMPADEEAALLASLEKAERELDSGKGVPLDKARDMVRRWASK